MFFNKLRHITRMVRVKLVIYCVIALQFIISNEAARILVVIPTPSISHQRAFRPFTQELAKRGHDVVVITTDPAFPKGKTPENLSEIDVGDISYDVWHEFVFASSIARTKDNLRREVNLSLDLLLKIFRRQLESKEVKELINNDEEFDLLIIEGCVKPAISLSYIYNKVPVILMSSLGPFGNYDAFGVSSHPILFPTFSYQRLYNLTFWEKMTEIYNHFMFDKMFSDHEELVNKELRNIVSPDIPNVNELNENAHMFFVNINPVWDACRPVPPSVTFIGGLTENVKEELSEDLKARLDNSTNGVIYVSFGSNIQPSLLSSDIIQILIKVLSQLPYDILLKWDQNELPGQSKNIIISKWWQQIDILKHPNTKLFITQGGLQSTDESIAAGVPLIGIPMLGDQWYNVEKYANLKIGLRLDMETLTEEQFKDAIETVIRDESYRLNVDRLRSLTQDQPHSALQRAVWWTEYVLRHGGARHLRSPAANVSFTQYFELELLLLLILSSLTVAIILLLSTVLIWKKALSFSSILLIINKLYYKIKYYVKTWKKDSNIGRGMPKLGP